MQPRNKPKKIYFQKRYSIISTDDPLVSTLVFKNGIVVFIDTEDVGKISIMKWSARKDFYVTCCYEGQRLILHRVIMGIPIGSRYQVVDHINLNKLDCRKSNLRICSASQNCMNKPKRNQKTSSKYKGVYKTNTDTDTPWVSYIYLGKTATTIGRYKTEKEAALEYNKKALQYFKEFARVNEVSEDTQ